jgi:hypothetical protein
MEGTNSRAVFVKFSGNTNPSHHSLTLQKTPPTHSYPTPCIDLVIKFENGMQDLILLQSCS